VLQRSLDTPRQTPPFVLLWVERLIGEQPPTYLLSLL
jgi:hypothetical protein